MLLEIGLLKKKQLRKKERKMKRKEIKSKSKVWAIPIPILQQKM